MHKRTDLPAHLRRLAASRHGVLTRRELLDAGVSRHAVTRMATSWLTLGRGVFATDPRADEWLAKVYGGLLLGGPSAAAWGATSLALSGMTDRPSIIEILTRLPRTGAQPWLRFHRQSDIHRRSIDLSPPRVNLDDAAIDAAATSDEVEALAIVARVLQERRSTPDRLLATLRARSRVRHRRLLEVAIGDSGTGSHSALEHLFVRDVQRQHGIEPLIRQYAVPETGHRADLARPEAHLLIELDGVRYHDREADRARDNRHASCGYSTLRFTWVDIIRDPCGVARIITIAIGTAMRRCPRCPAGVRT